MTGQEYLENIRTELQAGRYQHRMGENLLRAFGYVRRRATAIQEINDTLDELGLETYPPITTEMPLRRPRIRFRIKSTEEASTTDATDELEASDANDFDSPLQEAEEQDTDDTDSNLPEPAFTVSELASANTDVMCVSSSATIKKAYTKMRRHKFSQLVVADKEKPREQDIKGIISFQSMTRALMKGSLTTVGDCIDHDFCRVQSDTDLKSVVSQLSGYDVVLVIGRDKRLQGIVTAWDLADEFEELADPFMRIGEIEERLRALVRRRLEKKQVADFLTAHGSTDRDLDADIEELTMGELQRVLDFPMHWDALELPFERSEFIEVLGEVRGYRNRLMHFKEPLDEAEIRKLSNFCDMVREIQL